MLQGAVQVLGLYPKLQDSVKALVNLSNATGFSTSTESVPHATGFSTSPGSVSNAKGFNTSTGSVAHATGFSTSPGSVFNATGFSTSTGSVPHATGFSTSPGSVSNATGFSTSTGSVSHATGCVARLGLCHTLQGAVQPLDRCARFSIPIVRPYSPYQHNYNTTLKFWDYKVDYAKPYLRLNVIIAFYCIYSTMGIKSCNCESETLLKGWL